MRQARTDLDEVTAPLKAACALVETARQRGSGFLVRPDQVLTCAHVVREVGVGGRARVQFVVAGQTIEREAVVVAIDPAANCARLQLGRPVSELQPLVLRSAAVSLGAAWASYGFPAATLDSGLLLRGHLHEVFGQDLGGQAALVLASPNITAGAALQGFSGSPVWCGGQVVGMLRQVVPDGAAGAQFGIVYACPSAALLLLCGPAGAGEEPRRGPIPPPQSAYDPKWYVPRPEEESRAQDALDALGAAVVLQGPELYGKTWLLQYLRTRLLPLGRVAYLDLKNFSGETRGSFSAMLSEFGRQILAQTVCPDAEHARERVEQAWRRSSNPNDNLSWLLERHVLSVQPEGRWLVLCIDGADALLGQPYVDDFFSVLRYFTQNAAQPPWTGLKLLMTLSTAPSLLVRDINQSPFNVAYTIAVRDFDGEQVNRLAWLHGLPAAGCQQLIELVGGHPYLVRLALYEAARSQLPLAQIVEPTSGVFTSYLGHCLRRLRQKPHLYEALVSVLADPRAPLDYDSYIRLHHGGFLTEDEATGEYHPRCELYRRLVRGPRGGGSP